MKKRGVVEWAAISGILETIAVVASLLFVAYSMKQNTAVMQSMNDNFVYQIQDERLSDIVNNVELASLEIKVRNNLEITEVEKHRMLAQNLRELNMWELAYVRYQQGLYSFEQWDAWNRYYSIDLVEKLPEDWWAEVKPWYGDGDFARLVDVAYAKKRSRY